VSHCPRNGLPLSRKLPLRVRFYYQADAAGHSAYDVAPDGKRFLMIRNEGAGEIDLHVVLNLGEELRRRSHPDELWQSFGNS